MLWMDLKCLAALAHFNDWSYCNYYLYKITQIQSVIQYLEEKKKQTNKKQKIVLDFLVSGN